MLGAATIYEGLVSVLSLGFCVVETRAWLLFDVFDRDERGRRLPAVLARPLRLTAVVPPSAINLKNER